MLTFIWKGTIMSFTKQGSLHQFKWHIIIILCAILGLAGIYVFTDYLPSTDAAAIPTLLVTLGIAIILIAILTAMAGTKKIITLLSESGAKLDKIAEAMEKSKNKLEQINHDIKLSEPAKAIVFRDADRQALREAVFDKLHQKEFGDTYDIIHEMENYPEYSGIAKRLKMQADGFRDANEQERINQVVTHIGKLMDNHEWAKASHQIERLRTATGKSEYANAMRQQLRDKKEERKKILLQAWDDAVKRQDTDRNLEILTELDSYLTPNEGLALQEAARDVFRNKLHNLGVQFSLSISERQWKQALRTGVQIINDFPNSKMATEIREKIEILQKNAQQ